MQKAIMQEAIMTLAPRGLPWKEFAQAALRRALRSDAPLVLHEDRACYTTSEESVYVEKERRASLALLSQKRAFVFAAWSRKACVSFSNRWSTGCTKK